VAPVTGIDAATIRQLAGVGRIRALITVAGTPGPPHPTARLSRALATLDFMVSIDIYLNETTRHADVILPSEFASTIAPAGRIT